MGTSASKSSEEKKCEQEELSNDEMLTVRSSFDGFDIQQIR